MKRLLVIVLLFIVSVATSQTNVSGIISQNTTWAKSGSPYIVTNNLLVSTGVTLTVDSGVTVKIKGGKTLQILGELNAIGTQNDSIIITDFDQTSPFKSLEFGDSSEDVLFNSDGSWASGNILKFVKVLGGGENTNGSVIFASSTGLIENSTIARSNSSGVYLYKNTSHVNNGWMGSGSSSLKSVHVVSSEILSNNSNGFSCSCYQYNIGIIISDSKLNYNGGSGFTSGGGDHGGSHEFIITNNQFSYNQNKGYEGLTNGLQIVNGNRINNNGSIGVRLRGHGPYKIRSNYILYNAGGVDGDYTGIEIDSNVIAYNDWAIKSRAGGYFKIRGNQFIENGSSGIYASIYDPSSSWGKPVVIKRNSFIGNQSDSALIATINPNQGSYTFTVDSNNFGGNESKYYIYNTRAFSATNGVDATYNYFNGNDVTSMSDSIYDWSDNGSLSIVSLTNVSDSVNSFAPVLPPKKVFIYPGTNDYIVVEADLPSDFSNYRLYKGDCLFTDFTNDSTQLSNFNVDSIGYYSLTVRSNSASGCEDFFTGEESYHFTDIKLPYDLKSESSFCYGDSVKFTIERNNTTAVQATFFVTISDANNVLLTDTIPPGVSICYLDLQDSLRNDTTYTITISSNGFSYSRTTSVQLLKNPNFQISYSGDPAKCPGVQKTLEVPNGLTNVNWYRYQPWGNQGLGSSSSILAAGGESYFFRATGQDGCVNYSDTLGIDSISFLTMPSITADVPSNFCEGVSFNLGYLIPANRMYYYNAASSQWGSSPRISARWYKNDTLIDSVAYNPTITNNFGLNDSLPGVYKIRVGLSSCYRESAITMNALPNVDVSVSSVTDNTCHGDSQGSIKVNSQTANNYAWTSNQLSSIPNNDSIFNLPAGLYNLTVSRSNGCSKSLEVNISEPPEIVVSSVIESTTCNGDSDGAIYLSISDAVQPYAISWAGLASTSDTLEQLLAGLYIATIVDSNGCSVSDSILVSQPDILSLQLLSSNNVNCYQGQDGSATVSISGGNGGYVSSWKEVGTSSILSSTTTLSNVQAGVYRCTVVDSKGCTDSLDVTITQPASELTASISSKTDVLCNGDSTGSIIAQATGGTIGSGYSYLWTNNSNSVVSGSSLASGLTAGIYNCQVTDVNGCTNTVTDTILEPLAPVDIASSGISDVLCHGGNDGSLWVTPSGGVAPYTYSWNNLGTNDTIDNLAAGSYSVIVTDSNGCTKNQSFLVTQPSVLTNSVTQSIYIGNTNISCPGGTDGYINLLPAGGTSPYSYSWSNLDTTQNITGLSAGSYTCTITDANNCTSLANVSMTDPLDFVWASSITNVSCNGLDDGAISLGISGGNQPYVIDWTSSTTSQGEVEVTFRLDMSQQASFSASTVSNVIQGFTGPIIMSDLYNDSIFILSQKFNPGDTIYWRYFNGSIAEIVPTACGVNTGQSIFERFLIVPSNDTILPVVCFSSCQNCQGTIGSGLSGSIHNSSKSLIDISAGIYTFNLLDRNGCSTVYVDTVAEPAPLVLTVDSISNVTCKNADDANVSVTVTGGNGNYSYNWNGVSAASEDLSNVGPGDYTLVVVDDKGCSDSLSVTVTEPDSLIATSLLSAYVGGNNVSCNGATDGSIDVSVQGGTFPYSFAWNTSDTTEDLSNVGHGYYSVLITDYNGCNVTVGDSIVEPDVLTATLSTTDVSCNGGTDGTVSVNVAGGSGPYTVNWTSSNGGQINSAIGVTFRVNMSGEVIDSSGVDVILGSGQIIDMMTYDDSVYYATGYFYAGDSIKYRFFNGSNSEVVPVSCGITQNLTLFERLLVVGNDTTLPATIFSSCSASKPGTSGYAIGSTDSLVAVTSGTYTAVITDANGCTVTVQDSAVQPDVLVIVQDTLVDASCPQNADGYIGVTVTGGTGNYSFDWSNGDTTQNVTIGYGYHDLLVTDENGCQDSATYFVDAPFPYNDEEICVVTVDSTGVNMLVWDKTPGQRTSEYIILRENASTQYTSVGTSIFNNMSTYADQNSNPSIQPYRYKLVLQDSCGNYSDTSDYHSTIHLQASPGVAANEVQLSWTAYEGKAVQTYYIYRWLSPLNRILIDSVSSNVFTYTDIYPVTTTITALLYEVGAKFVNGGCSPTAGKQGTYANSMSNILDWGTDGGVSIGTDEWVDVVLDHDLELYPNPTFGRLNLELTGAWEYQRDIQIKILDVTGRIVATSVTDGIGTVQLDLSHLPASVYVINIITNEGRIFTKRFERVN